jgi:hypothetical protein
MLKRIAQAPDCRQIAQRDLPWVTLCPNIQTHPLKLLHHTTSSLHHPMALWEGSF